MDKENIIGTPKESREIDIDLLELLMALKRKIVMIIIAGLLGAVLAGGLNFWFLTPQYRSSTIMYMRSNDTILTSLSDLQIGSQLTQDYKVIVTSRPVLQKVVDSLNLGYTYRDLKAKLSVENPKDTRILTITVQDEDPYMAKK